MPLLFLTLVLVGACSNSSEPAPATTATPAPEASIPSGRGNENILRLLFWQAPTTFNPHLTSNQRDWNASRIIFEPLATFDKEGNLIPFLAAEIPSLENGGLAEDGRSVTWMLRQDVRWSDGEAFTADDVLFTYNYITDPDVGSASAANYGGIESVEALDEFTVRVNFSDVNPAWSLAFVGVQGLILPQHVFEGYEGGFGCEAMAALQPPGTGSYRLATCKPEEVLFLGNELVQTIRVIYEPNEFFREEGKPYFNRVELLGGGTVNEAARQVLQTGTIDYAWNLTLDNVTLAELEALGVGRLITNFGSRVERLQINFTDPDQTTATGERSSLQFSHPFFSDPRVRQAFSYAIDREAIAALYGPTGSPTSNILVSPANFASTNTSYEFNLEKAIALLDEAGWVDTNGDGIRDKDGDRMKVVFQTTVSPLRQRTQEIVKEALESIGVEVEIKLIDAATFGNRDPDNTNNAWHFYADMQMLFFGNRSPDPAPYMEQWVCAQIPQQENEWAGSNIERWCSPAYDALLAEAATEIDPERRAQLFVLMNDMLVNEFVMIPLVHLGVAGAVKNDITGVDLTPWDVDVWNIMDWRRSTP
ncbi:MAG: peptide ABC transporter substrate-binding protein [Chloroflexi bacterium]|nr:peptide ABC transporter substrate-binding protein [Chloroflexota bacterium]MCI0580295.1 peptide ABC transporter substrate-binding protein [Chloroflexota bacterium]MCI0648086.1 peptide ABC transporter substrate-binding protein [Chloroflexota bacterium]MCI0730917.1 peptide ABC transporter substrate-binding protein [Chloroflexota bacterium]